MQKAVRERILFVLILIGMFNSKRALCQKPFEVKIMSYNIRHASPPSHPGTINVDTVAAVIRKYQPDFVALQEVDVHTGRSGKVLDEAKEIGSKAGMYSHFGKAINYDGGEYGVAILSKYEFDSVAVYKLPSANQRAEARVLAVGFFHIADKQHFGFACTHLDAEADNASRMMQIKVIDSILSLLSVPLILAGDLNSEPDSPTIQFLDHNFVRTCMDSCGYTFPSDRPVKTIDYIAFHKSNPFQVLEHYVLNEAYPSDHLPILAKIRINSRQKSNKAGKKKKGI